METETGKLFVGGISWDTNEERMKEYFENFGEVLEVVIMKDRNTGRARGFGFVVFTDPAVSERVVLEKHVIDGRTVEAKKAVPRDEQNHSNRNSPSIQGSPSPARTKKIFVGGLASTVTENDFKTYFQQFGMVTDAVVMYDHTTQRPRGFGFITYELEDAVDKVLLKTFHEVNGKMVEVKRAVPKELSPGPTRGPLAGYNPSLNRVGNLLSGYNQSPIGAYGMRMDGRYSPIAMGHNGYSPLGPSNFGMGHPFDSGFSANHGEAHNLVSDIGYRRMVNPVFNDNINRFNTGYGGPYEGRTVMNSPSRNLWGNEGVVFGNSANVNPIGPGNGSSGAGVIGNGGMGSLWDSSHISGQFGGGASTYNSGNFNRGYQDINNGSGLVGYGRNIRTSLAGTITSSTMPHNYEEKYGGPGHGNNYYEGSSFSGNSGWRIPSPEPEGYDPFGYGLRTSASEAAPKDAAVYTDGYSVTNRQSVRGIAA